MTAEERYQFIREQTNLFKNRGMMRHHLIRHFKESMNDGLDAAAALCVNGRECCKEIERAIRSLKVAV